MFLLPTPSLAHTVDLVFTPLVINSPSLQQDKPTEEIEHFFRQVVTAVECTGNEISADRSQHVERLKKVYDVVLSSSEAGKYNI